MSAVDMHEPYTHLTGLTLVDLEDLLEDIRVYMQLEKEVSVVWWWWCGGGCGVVVVVVVVVVWLWWWLFLKFSECIDCRLSFYVCMYC